MLGCYMADLVPLPVAAVVPVALSDGSDIPALASWLVSEEGRRHSGVCQWINFLAAHYAQFRIIQELFPKMNPGRQSMKDWFGMGTTPEEMLVIANQLFILRSYGIEGSVLECGCYKGYSSCCLSISCRRLGYPLVIADSFAGLPADPNEVGDDRYYQVGDFAVRGSRSSKTYAPSEIPSAWSWWKAGSRTPSRGGTGLSPCCGWMSISGRLPWMYWVLACPRSTPGGRFSRTNSSRNISKIRRSLGRRKWPVHSPKSCRRRIQITRQASRGGTWRSWAGGPHFACNPTSW